MLETHVVVDALPFRKRRQTLPTNMRLAARARHVVASFAALDGCFAARTTLDVIVRRPLVEQFVFGNVTLFARHAVVVLYTARCTDANETRGALQDGVRRRGAIHLCAVGGGTMTELVRSTVNIHPESRLDDRVEIGDRQEFPRQAKRDALSAGGFVPKAP